VWAQSGVPKVVFDLVIAGDVITAIEVVADPERLQGLDIQLLA
jgi:hypothetical protein